jgi:hypothetical protein
MRGGAGTDGMVVYFDLAASDTSVTASTSFGAASNPTSNVVQAGAAQDGGASNTTTWVLGVLDEDIADDAEGWCTLRGVVKVQTDATSQAAGEGVSPVASGYLGDLTQDSKIYGITLETTGTTAGALKWMIFDGIYGFGTHSAGV